MYLEINFHTADISEEIYWYGEGQYQKEHDAAYKELVPDSGEAKILEGQLLLSINALYHDFYNNGFSNLSDSSRLEEAIDILNKYRNEIGIEKSIALIIDFYDETIIASEHSGEEYNEEYDEWYELPNEELEDTRIVELADALEDIMNKVTIFSLANTTY